MLHDAFPSWLLVAFSQRDELAVVLRRALGSGPLLAIIIATKLGLTRDPHPNPVDVGVFGGLTFWPDIGLQIAGIVTVQKLNRTHGRK